MKFWLKPVKSIPCCQGSKDEEGTGGKYRKLYDRLAQYPEGHIIRIKSRHTNVRGLYATLGGIAKKTGSLKVRKRGNDLYVTILRSANTE